MEKRRLRTEKMLLTVVLSGVILFLAGGVSTAGSGCLSRTSALDSYQDVIERTAGMVSDPAIASLARKCGLSLLNLTWEDTGRYKGSCVGPNISDMTIQIQRQDPRSGRYSLTCMPVMRYPNFSDKTADISPDRFYLLVGNEKGKSLRRVSLREYLGNLRKYLSSPSSWKGRKNSLLAPRDTHVLVSAQACFLPVPRNGSAEFNAVLFNYQSMEKEPAVLAILATREGTSATIIDNKRDAFRAGATWGQRLFFNQDGERASLTGVRLSDYEEDDQRPGNGWEETSPEAAGESGLNMVLLIQVPLRQKHPMRFSGESCDFSCKCQAGAGGNASDMEEAVIGHGEIEGPFTEIDNLPIERDPDFPIRVTVQFYQATASGIASSGDLCRIKRQIDRVYRDADYVGSLVTGGDTGRPTEYKGGKQEPAHWWDSFWRRNERNTGLTREESRKMLRRLLNPHCLEDSCPDTY
jgi:hypothetical protein